MNYRISLPIAALLIFFLSFGIQGQDTAATYRNFQGQKPMYISDQVWKKALESYFTSCNGGDCKCTLMVSEKIDPTTAFTWIGHFKGGQINGLLGEYSRMKATSVGGAGSGSDSSHAKPLSRCHTGNAKATGSNCCAIFPDGSRKCGSENCKYYQELGAQMGIPPERRIQRIYFASTLVPGTGIYLHESTGACSGPPCEPTLGCLTISPLAMKGLCENYIGMDAEATGRSAPENGGVFIFFKNASMPSYRGASEEKAIKGLESYLNKCGSMNFASLGGGSFGRTRYKMGSTSFPEGAHSSPSDEGPSRSPASSGGGGFFSFFSKLFSGMWSGSGPAASGGDSYQQYDNKR